MLLRRFYPFVLLFLCVSGRLAEAQSTYTPDFNHVGLPANGAFSGGSIDTVQLNTGNLHVDIPLLHLPGIGQDTDIHFIYDSQVFNVITVPYSSSGTTPWFLITMNRQFGQVSDPLAGFLKWGQHNMAWECGNPYPTQWSATYLDYMSFTDKDGTGHSFPVSGYNRDLVVPCAPVQWYPQSSYSQDASGYNVVLDNSGNVLSLIDKHGTKYSLGGTSAGGTFSSNPTGSGQPQNPIPGDTILQYRQVSSVEDSNGNIISAGFSSDGAHGDGVPDIYTITDTVNRKITETFDSSGPSTYNIIVESTATQPSSINYTDQNGATQTITINYAAVPVDLSLLCQGSGDCGTQVGISAGTIQMQLPHTIVLQNGDTYTLNYVPNSLGELQSINLPTGGVISYTWTTLPLVYGRSVNTRTVTANGQTSQWQYTYSAAQPTPPYGITSFLTTVTDPALNDTVFTCNPKPNNNLSTPSAGGRTCYMTNEVIYNGPQSSNSPIATKATGYKLYQSWTGGSMFLPTSDILTWNQSGLVTETDTNYDYQNVPGGAGTVSYDLSRGNITSKLSYDYGSGSAGAILSNTQYSYLHDQNSNYANANIGDRVSQVSIYNSATVSSSTLVAQTTTAYDQFNQASINSQSALTPTTGTDQHDYTNYGSTYTLRGLPTSVTKYVGGGAAPVVTYTNYNDLGLKTLLTDGRLHTSKYYYGAQNAFVSSILLPMTSTGVQLSLGKGYDVNTGLLTSETDVANLETSYSYDARMRPLTVQRPDGGMTTNTYPDPNHVNTSVVQDAAHTLNSSVVLDGLGRKITSVAPSGATTDTKYDSLGRIQSVSNPHYGSSSSTDGITSYAYDPIGRPTLQCQPDNNNNNPCVPGASYLQWSYSGNASSDFGPAYQVDFYDEASSHWQRFYDGLGRISEVLEPDPVTNAPSISTHYYNYDALGNLGTIDQWSGPAGDLFPPTGFHEERSFTYDGLSRLVTAKNPETGTVCYGTISGSPATCTSGYDGNNNLLSKTDARGQVVSYAYDELNRLLSKTYPNDTQGTPSTCYAYDVYNGAVPDGGATNPKGHLLYAWTQFGTCPSYVQGGYLSLRKFLGYDPMGRVILEKQCSVGACTAGLTYDITSSFDMVGHETGYTNGVQNLSFTRSYDGTGRLQSMMRNGTPTTVPDPLLSVESYMPTDQIQSMALGQESIVTRTYDNRPRPTGETVIHP